MKAAAPQGWAGKSAWSMLDNGVQQLLSFFIFALLARWLTPHEFGLLAIAHLMVLFVRMSLLDALAMPVVRAAEADNALYDWLFTLCALVAGAAAALMALLAWPLAGAFGTPALAPVLLGMSLSVLLFGLARAHEARLVREGNFRLAALRSLCAVSAGGAVALWLAARGHGALALVAQQLVMGVVALAIALVAEWRLWRPRWRWSMVLLRAHAAEMSRVGLNAWVHYANGHGDAALVSVLFGPQATGLYNLAKRVLSAAYLVVAASLSRVGVSLFVQRQGDPAALAQGYTRLLGWTLLLLAPVYALATLVAEPLVVMAFGEPWRASAEVFGWLSVAYVSHAVLSLGQQLSFSTGRSARVLRLSAAQLGLSLALAMLLAPLGPSGVAAGFALAGVTGCAAMQFAVQRQLALSGASLARAAAPAVLGTLATAAVLWGVSQLGHGAVVGADSPCARCGAVAGVDVPPGQGVTRPSVRKETDTWPKQ